tara:strand:+ start:44784 stop:44936 length:153 start_codon:yes stop_codon:yes gene_type:complete
MMKVVWIFKKNILLEFHVVSIVFRKYRELVFMALFYFLGAPVFPEVLWVA